MQAGRNSSSIVLGVIRCFIAAAFLALSAFYFGMFCFGKPVIDHVELVPLSQAETPRQAAAGALQPVQRQYPFFHSS